MEATDLAYLSIRQAANLIQTRQVSPSELTEACIDRAQSLDGELHAYLATTFETAREQAKAATDAIAAGERRGLLHGIPFGIKDLYDIEGVPTTGGARLREPSNAAKDARSIELLREAGAVFLGKLNLHEWAMGGSNVNYFYPTPRNPWNREYVTGGSSGGSGLALAAGFCLGSLGSDTRGSIRMPASLCGVTGIKPTHGRVSLRGVIPLVWSLDCAGPMARDAYDCALILNAIAGYDEEDPITAEVPVPDYVAALEPAHSGAKPLEGLRIGLPRSFFFDEDAVDAEIIEAVRATLPVFQSLGAEVVEIDFPDPEAYQDNRAFDAESAAYHEERYHNRPEELSDLPRQRVGSNLELKAIEYARARWRQQVFKQKVHHVFREVDLILTPTSPVPGLLIAEVEPAGPGRILARHTSPFNTLHTPVASLPCGFVSGGLPVGLQLAGRWWEESVVLRAAHAYQQVTDWHLRRPSLT